ncbi:hypothetical protein PR048_019081 [Dryococelus australis]|uniref:Uncharacterized protein n=1 Tax=Dryococelus australis TaxID=614101 RepID=A0ABQ9H2H2_9NEOP|nr:hypothetical protein PR048_019081 [Dryococelus australis]
MTRIQTEGRVVWCEGGRKGVNKPPSHLLEWPRVVRRVRVEGSVPACAFLRWSLLRRCVSCFNSRQMVARSPKDGNSPDRSAKGIIPALLRKDIGAGVERICNRPPAGYEEKDGGFSVGAPDFTTTHSIASLFQGSHFNEFNLRAVHFSSVCYACLGTSERVEIWAALNSEVLRADEGPQWRSGQGARLSRSRAGLDSRRGGSRTLVRGIAPDDAADRRVFSRISRFPCTCIPALLRSSLASPSSALRTSLLGAAQSSPLVVGYKMTSASLNLPLTAFASLGVLSTQDFQNNPGKASEELDATVNSVSTPAYCRGSVGLASDSADGRVHDVDTVSVTDNSLVPATGTCQEVGRYPHLEQHLVSGPDRNKEPKRKLVVDIPRATGDKLDKKTDGEHSSLTESQEALSSHHIDTPHAIYRVLVECTFPTPDDSHLHQLPQS